MTVIGLEVHVQLDTCTKLFCACPVEFGADPNTHVCPVCLGLPGALPVLNHGAVELAVRAAVALGCDVRTRSTFARKNYFYPDLPKGYQITQYDRPLAVDGDLTVPADGPASGERVRIRRLHLEEDSGSSLHDRFQGATAVDLNRAGTPLIEIVTEPDIREPGQSRAFMQRLKRTLEYLEVSDCNMEEGSLRVDANISVRSDADGDDEPGVRTEIKNLNSFSQLERALAFEARRQRETLESGGRVIPQTLLWDSEQGIARPMRAKEEERDYRYFPEPDLPDLVVDPATVARIRDGLPELPDSRLERFVEDYELPRYDAEVLCASRELADFYEAVVASGCRPKRASNWMMGPVLRLSNDRGVPAHRLGLSPDDLAELIDLVERGALSENLGKEVLERMVETGRTPLQIVDDENMRAVTDPARIQAWVQQVLSEHTEESERYRAGEEKLLGFLMGQVMSRSGGRADPDTVRRALLEALGGPDGLEE